MSVDRGKNEGHRVVVLTGETSNPTSRVVMATITSRESAAEATFLANGRSHRSCRLERKDQQRFVNPPPFSLMNHGALFVH